MAARKIRDKRLALYERASECIEQDAPEGFDKFNEAERDRIYLKAALHFIFSQFDIFATMTYHKGVAFFYTGWTKETRVITLLAVIGAVITVRSKKARVLTLLTLLYAVPYSLLMPLFYRYRYPIETILLVLASHVCILTVSRISNFYKGWRVPEGQPCFV